MGGAQGRAGRAAVVAFALLLLVADAVWSAGYVMRTSFERDGARVFCLWDDAMISMRYARNLVEGNGLVWNPGEGEERVQGYTNLGVTLVMAGLHLLPLGPTRVSLAFQVLNAAALAAMLLLVGWIARRRMGGDAVAAASMIAVALCAPLHLWSLQGSDVGPVALFTLVALAGVAGAERDWPRWILPWLAVGVSLRPDFSLVYAVFLVVWLRGARITPRRLAVGVAPLALVWGALVAFSQLYYGDPLPNTWYLKATGTPRLLMLESGLLALSFWLPGAVTAGALALIAVLSARRNPVAEIAAGVVAVTLAYDVWVGGDWKSEFGSRYLAAALPLLLMLAVAGADVVARFALGSMALPRTRGALLLAVAVATSLLVAPQRALRDWFDPGAEPMLRSENERNYDLARYIDRNTLPSTTVAVHFGGVPPYFGERRAIDVLGKSDRHIAHLDVDRFIPGHSKWDWEYVLEERKPDIFLVQTRGLAEQPYFRQHYVVVRTAGDLRFFMRRDSLDKLTDVDVVLVDPRSGAHRPRREHPPRTRAGHARIDSRASRN